MASKEQNDLIAQQTARLSAQLNVMRDLAKAAQQIDFSAMSNGFSKINSAIKNSAENMNSFNSGQQTLEEMNKAAKQSAKDIDKMSQNIERFGKKALKAAPIIAAIEGSAGGFKLTANAISSLASVAGGLASTFLNVGASIISLPFKILYGLMNNVGVGGTALREEFEKIRGTFGDLTQNEGRDLIQSWRKIDHFGGQLAETGLSIWRTMGNMAETMAALREIAEKMGPLFHNFSRELNDNGERVFAYQKGLHLTDEGLRAVTEQASRAGTSFQEVGRHITSTAFALGDAFRMNGAIISQDVGTMMNDFEHFGNLGVKQLSQVSVYARKLGIEIDKLTSSLDAFADFDKAAENVSQLSQAFGVQLDTLQMVQEQDPAANIDRLRKAFFATGRTVETMTRQERALLAQTTGLDQKTASLVFSQKNAGLSYGEIQKQGANAEKQQLSQVEAMERLSNSIQRLVKQGPELKGGFFDIFLQGFFRGIKWTKEFWGLMIKLRYAMRMTYRAGRRVGQMFVKYFPGVKDMLKGMGDLFDRARWRKMLHGVVTTFKDFFKDLTSNPSIALSSLFKKLKSTFFDWFNTTTPSGKKTIEGFKTFSKAIMNVFAQLVRVGMTGAADAIRGIIGFIGDPSAVMSAANSAGSGLLSFIVELIEPAWRAIKDTWPALRDALLDLFAIAWEKIKPALWAAAPYIAGILFGPAIIGAITRTLIMTLGVAFLKGMVGFVKSGILGKGAKVLEHGVNSTMQAGNNLSRVSRPGAGAGAMAEVGATAGATRAVETETRGFGAAAAVKLGLKLLAIAGAIALGGIAVAFSIVAISKILTSSGITKIQDALLPLTIIAATIVGMVGVSLAAKVLSGVSPGVFGKALIGVALISALTLLMAGNLVLISKIMGGITPSMAETVKTGMGTMLVVYLASSALTLVAAAVGLLASSFSGLGALAMIAGMGMIALVATAAALHATSIMRVINNVHVDAGFEQKSTVFVNLIKAIGDFAGNISSIIEMSTPSFLGLLMNPFGRDPEGETSKTIGMVVRLVEAIGGQSRQLIETMVTAIKDVSVEDLSKADKVAAILAAIGGLAKALVPPPELFDNMAATIGLTPEILMAAGNYLKLTTGALTYLVPQTLGFLKLLEGMPNVDTGKVQAFSSFLTGIGSLLQALVPSGANAGVAGIALGASSFSKALANGANNMSELFGGGRNYEVANDPAADFLNFLRQYMTSTLNIIKDFMPVMSEFMSSFAGIANSIPTDKIEQIKLTSSLFEQIVEVVKSLSSSMSFDNIKDMSKAGPAAISAVGDMLKNYSLGIFSSLKTEIPRVINSILAMAKGLRPGEISRLKTIIPVVSDTFGLINILTDAVNTLGAGGSDISGGKELFEARLDGVQAILQALFSDSGGATIISSIKSLGTVVIPRQASTNATRIKGVLEAVGSLGELLKSGIINRLSGGGNDMKGVNTFFAHLFMRNWNSGAGKGIHWLNAIDELGRTAVPPRALSNANRLKDILAATEEIGGHIQSAAGNLDSAMIERVSTGVTALTERMAGISRVLSSASGFNIVTKLTELNHKLGLTSTGNLHIAQEPVNLNVNFTINIDAKELEDVLINRDGNNIATKHTP